MGHSLSLKKRQEMSIINVTYIKNSNISENFTYNL